MFKTLLDKWSSLYKRQLYCHTSLKHSQTYNKGPDIGRITSLTRPIRLAFWAVILHSFIYHYHGAVAFQCQIFLFFCDNLIKCMKKYTPKYTAEISTNQRKKVLWVLIQSINKGKYNNMESITACLNTLWLRDKGIQLATKHGMLSHETFMKVDWLN